MKRRRARAQIISSRLVFQGKVFRVWREKVVEPGLRGKAATRAGPALREWVEHPGSVVILPVRRDGRVVLVRQYRHPLNRFTWELVAGHMDAGESPQRAARRELREETGYTTRRLEKLAELYPSPGFLSERMIVYRATGLKAGRPHPEDDEELESRAFPLGTLLRMIRNGRIRDGKTLVGILLHAGKARRRQKA